VLRDDDFAREGDREEKRATVWDLLKTVGQGRMRNREHLVRRPQKPVTHPLERGKSNLGICRGTILIVKRTTKDLNGAKQNNRRGSHKPSQGGVIRGG